VQNRPYASLPSGGAATVAARAASTILSTIVLPTSNRIPAAAIPRRFR
jgi:hypothetical protein